MTQLLEWREKIRTLYYQHDVLFRGAAKFVLAFSVFFAVIWQVGDVGIFMAPVIAVSGALICAWLPAGAISFFLSVLITGSLWKISMETGAVCAVLFLLELLLYFSFRPKHSVLMAVTMLACTFNMSGMVPLAVGLLFDPLALIPMALGAFSYDMVETVRANYSILVSQSSRLSAVEKVIYYMDCLFGNEKVLLLVAAFSLTVLVVYVIRRRPFAYAWGIAVAAGLMVQVLVLLAGNVLFDISIIVPALILSCVLGVLGACAAMLFGFVLDGSRTEYLEYEDDEYYYFVKAIPKVSVTVSEKRVTNITERQDEEDPEDFWQPDPIEIDEVPLQPRDAEDPGHTGTEGLKKDE